MKPQLSYKSYLTDRCDPRDGRPIFPLRFLSKDGEPGAKKRQKRK